MPDWVNARINGKKATDVITGKDATNYFENEFTPKVATRGGALIKKWGRSSAASTAVSIADAIRSLVQPTPEGDCFSSAVISDGNPYGVPEGIVYSFPLKSKGDGNWEFVRLYYSAARNLFVCSTQQTVLSIRNLSICTGTTESISPMRPVQGIVRVR